MIEKDLCEVHSSFSYRILHTKGKITEVLELSKDSPHDPASSLPQQMIRIVRVVTATEQHRASRDDINYTAGKPATTNHTPDLYGVISLYREQAQRPFTKTEGQNAAVLAPHLIEAWIIRLYSELQTTPAIFNAIGESAICDAQGAIWCSSPQFSELLRDEWPNERVCILPAELTKIIHDGGNGVAYDGKQVRCVISSGPTSGLFYVHIRKQPPLSHLPPRQRRIAIELAQGKTYNQIAHNLGISRSTVTNHANAIYSKLGISNKVQLAIICFGHTLQSLIM